MIIENGYISCKIVAGGGLVDGNPVRQSEAWGEPIICHINTNMQNNKGLSNGNSFTVASYEVLIEEQAFDAKRIKLVKSNKDLGEFSVLSLEVLGVVGLIKITV